MKELKLLTEKINSLDYELKAFCEDFGYDYYSVSNDFDNVIVICVDVNHRLYIERNGSYDTFDSKSNVEYPIFKTRIAIISKILREIRTLLYQE